MQNDFLRIQFNLLESLIANLSELSGLPYITYYFNSFNLLKLSHLSVMQARILKFCSRSITCQVNHCFCSRTQHEIEKPLRRKLYFNLCL